MTDHARLNTGREFCGVTNTTSEFTGTASDVGGWIDVVVFLASFVGRSWRITNDDYSWTLNYRYPVQS